MFENIWLVTLPMAIPRGDSKVLSLSLCAPNTHICVIAIDHCLEEPHRNIIIDPPAEDMEKCFVIDGIEEFADIPAPEETVGILCEKILCTFYGSEKTFSFTTRPHIVDECPIINFNQMLIEQPVYETIFDTGDGNISSLRIAHAERTISTMFIGFALKFR